MAKLDSRLSTSKQHHLLMTLLIMMMLMMLQLNAAAAAEETHADTSIESSSSNETEGIKVIDWKWHELNTYCVIVMFLIVTCILKTIYHHIHILVTYVPESNVLIILGVVIGVIVFFAVPPEQRTHSFWIFEPDLFFFILLPPIMLEAAYSLYDRAFVDNIGSILFLAVGGTVANFLIIGFGMFGIGSITALGGQQLSLKIYLLFGSFIVAVDPVAVLAIFHDIGVDRGLYYLVFGESLLNDAVTVVLYNTMNSFVPIENISVLDIVLGVESFFTISIGGLIVGIVFGVACSIVTRFTYSTKVVEPLVILTMAYGSYIFGDLLGWSGLIAIISCGIVQAAYAFHNVSRKSLTTLKYFTKMTASIGEAIVFLYLGVELVKRSHVWDTRFAVSALLLCLAARFIVTYASTFLLNLGGRNTPIKFTEKFVIAFGGLRGAVAFALATLVRTDTLVAAGAGKEEKEIFVTTTLFIVMFTCMGIGMTIKPIVKCLNIRLEKHQITCVFHEVVNHSMDHLNAGIEEIVGRHGDNYAREIFERIDSRYIRPLLQRDPATHDEQIVDTFYKVGLKMHLALSSRDRDKSSQMLKDLAPNLSSHLSSSGSIEGFGRDESTNSFNIPKRRIGERRLSVSANPETLQMDDFRKVMMNARRRSSMAPRTLDKNLHSEQDVEHHLKDKQTRVANAMRMLRHSSSLMRGRNPDGKNGQAISSAGSSEGIASESGTRLDSINVESDQDLQQSGERRRSGKRIKFSIPDSIIWGEDASDAEEEAKSNGYDNSTFQTDPDGTQYDTQF